MADPCGVSISEHVSATGGAEARSGLGASLDPISETVGFEFSKAEDPSESTAWKPATANDPAKTRAHYAFASPVDVGAACLQATGLDGVDAAYRVRWAPEDEFMEKPASPLAAGVTDTAKTATDHWTLSTVFRLEPANLLGGTGNPQSTVCEIRNHVSTSTNSTRLVQIRLSDTGTLLVNLPRYSGSLNTSSFALNIGDCLPHWVELSFDDTGGSGGTLTVRGDGADLGTMTTAQTFLGGTIYLATTQYHRVGLLELWETNHTAAESATFRHKILTGHHPNLGIGLMFTATDAATPTTVANIASSGSSYDMTLGAGTWSTITHP